MEVVLVQIEKQFLSGYPLNKWCWKAILEIIVQMDDEALLFQKRLLERTVLHPLMDKFPLKLSYQNTFLKMLVTKMEESNAEVCDEIYEVYCRLLGSGGNHENCLQDKHYRHFALGKTYISLQESTSIISEGTTGLYAWQASMALAEWCLKHKETYLKGKNILELGSGVGLTGLACLLSTCNQPMNHQGAVSEDMKEINSHEGGENPQILEKLSLSPSAFTFSDCHPSVLTLLCGNVRMNLMDSSTESTSNTSLRCPLLGMCYGTTKVRVINLLWQDVEAGSKETLDVIGQVDIVIAADVVYDQSLFKPLIGALKTLTSMNNGRELLPVILACTKRNPETLKEFIDCLTKSGFLAVEEEPVQPQYFVYESDPAVGIYRITVP
ncbi:protein-lysine N-methyltransferase EEF2KMT [Ischnura elegans]|uniref:protein-lysine N-methyltransferase EEF2KMT n=1 Tax=Ischnura elegans TaxID=197161 RepID=UPI001ED89658|nr:protein-lysine N-methyltransferase EEF2KMT [Ischnura elegans]